MDTSFVLYLLAAVSFGLAFANVGRFNWTAGGFCLVTIATFLI